MVASGIFRNFLDFYFNLYYNSSTEGAIYNYKKGRALNMIRPRLKVSQEAWDTFLTNVPRFEQMVEKLAEYKSLGNMDELALPYTLHEFLGPQTLLFASAFNPDTFECLFKQGQKDLLKFIQLVKNKQQNEDSLKWEEYDKTQIPNLYPAVENSNSAKDVLTWAASKDTNIMLHEVEFNIFFVKSLFTFRCLCAWLTHYNIPFTADTNFDINNRKLKTLWYDYVIRLK